MGEMTERVARALYAAWSAPDEPDWSAYESGDELNIVGLLPEHFREDARHIGPFDTVQNVARRICRRHGYMECIQDGCTVATCDGWEMFRFDAEAAIDAAIKD